MTPQNHQITSIFKKQINYRALNDVSQHQTKSVPTIKVAVCILCVKMNKCGQKTHRTRRASHNRKHVLFHFNCSPSDTVRPKQAESEQNVPKLMLGCFSGCAVSHVFSFQMIVWDFNDMKNQKHGHIIPTKNISSWLPSSRIWTIWLNSVPVNPPPKKIFIIWLYVGQGVPLERGGPPWFLHNRDNPRTDRIKHA